MASTINIPSGIMTLNPVPVNSKRFNKAGLPYENIEQVFEEIPVFIREKGLTVFVTNKEWWFKDGNQDTDLVLKVIEFENNVTEFRTSNGDLIPIIEKTITLPVGMNGPAGAKGEIGLTGATGANGNVGAEGDKGETGLTGAEGTAGIKGDKGDKGDAGANGIEGEKGETGLTGAEGIQGPNGSQGTAGLKGDTGAEGSEGIKGDKGEQGVPGEIPVEDILTDESLFYNPLTKQLRANVSQTTQTFTWQAGSQVFTLTDIPSNIILIAVNGTMLYNQITQWSMDVQSKKITVLTPLNTNDTITINYQFVIL